MDRMMGERRVQGRAGQGGGCGAAAREGSRYGRLSAPDAGAAATGSRAPWAGASPGRCAGLTASMRQSSNAQPWPLFMKAGSGSE